MTCAARLAQREWTKAETAARGTVDLFGADDETVLMLELAQQGRGPLVHRMARPVVSGPDGRPAALDPAARAREAFARRAATAGTVPVVDPETALPQAEPFHLRGRAPLVPAESSLRAEPAAVTDESAARAWLPHLHRTWLLIALRRYAEALDAVEAARRGCFGAPGHLCRTALRGAALRGRLRGRTRRRHRPGPLGGRSRRGPARTRRPPRRTAQPPLVGIVRAARSTPHLLFFVRFPGAPRRPGLGTTERSRISPP
ncbi:hypothetical protein ACFUCQ_16235 [Streptomyces sp. NPDC057197]|uniref:hypothetical protein n=1 Tax=Streptomyces sp. NPDC057197 TaxID=3346045 RepID=UPI00362C1462